MENLSTLVPAVVSLKDLLAAVTGIEEMLEGKSADGGVTPTEVVRDWLIGKEITQ
jgi:hypothetical protein